MSTCRPLKTGHNILFEDSKNLSFIPDNSVDLMVTSPPYPMIEMWDDLFAEQNPIIKEKMLSGFVYEAFELMHQELDAVWREVYRVLKEGSIACINIGDATRTIDNKFQIYSNHSRILSSCLNIGFQVLPEIIWRKQTNAPNKFMGSGMLPPGAYVTLEHEYIIVLRKGNKRNFNTQTEKKIRQESAYFWEERNIWFSDVWEGLKGTKQNLKTTGAKRNRSAAFPFELAYRLIQMFSTRGDTVLDPYLGTGTTTVAAMASERNSIGIEKDESFKNVILDKISTIVDDSNEYISNRITSHLQFVEKREDSKGPMKYNNNNYGFKVMTKQEQNIKLNYLTGITQSEDMFFEVCYSMENNCQLNKIEKEDTDFEQKLSKDTTLDTFT